MSTSNISNETTPAHSIEAILGQDARLSFVYSLHATLDLNQITERFMTGLKQVIEFDHLRYRNNELDITSDYGKSGSIALNYQLRAHNQYLGEVDVTRNREFTESEIDRVEEYLVYLINPVANAIEYRKALQSALHDPLTGLHNRVSLESTLVREIELAKRHNQPLTLLALDIDHFKHINDTFGHLAGDQYLKDFAKTLSEVCRETDLIYRTGGEEFLVILNNADTEGASRLAERTLEATANLHCQHKQKVFHTTASVGVATYEATDDHESLLQRTDNALYQAKQDGRNRYCTA